MTFEEKDGKWLVNCNLCSWKRFEESREKAENSYADHVSREHRAGTKGVDEQGAHKPKLIKRSFRG